MPMFASVSEYLMAAGWSQLAGMPVRECPGPRQVAMVFLQKICKVRGLVHFSARTDEIHQKSLPENMDLTPSCWTLQFSWVLGRRLTTATTPTKLKFVSLPPWHPGGCGKGNRMLWSLIMQMRALTRREVLKRAGAALGRGCRCRRSCPGRFSARMPPATA